MKTHTRHSDLRVGANLMDIDPRSLTSPTAHCLFSRYRLPFLQCPFLNPSIPCGPLPPQFLEALKPRSPCPHCPTRWRCYQDALTTNHSASMPTNETWRWSLIVVDDEHIESPGLPLDYSLDKAKPSPFELGGLWFVLSLRSTSRKVVPSCSDSDIMPYGRSLSTVVVTGGLSRKFKGSLVN